ncbi:hypothetical protein, partial [Thiolapillus sp.]|uniref:hypothetical protein n=3 Tax=Thiolapillus sp. TaxID=2017437 RepID=UPI003AF4D9B4
LLWTVRFSRIVTSGAGMVFLCINALDHNCTILHRISHRLFPVFQLNFNDLAFIDGNKIATLFHPKIYGGTMLLTLNSSTV